METTQNFRQTQTSQTSLLTAITNTRKTFVSYFLLFNYFNGFFTLHFEFYQFSLTTVFFFFISVEWLSFKLRSSNHSNDSSDTNHSSHSIFKDSKLKKYKFLRQDPLADSDFKFFNTENSLDKKVEGLNSSVMFVWFIHTRFWLRFKLFKQENFLILMGFWSNKC